jgi:hypothetical protein
VDIDTLMLRSGVRPFGCHTPHSALLLPLASLAPPATRTLPATLVPTRRLPRSSRAMRTWIRRLHHASHSESRLPPRLAPPTQTRAHPLAVATAEARAADELRTDDLHVTSWYRTLRRRQAMHRRAFYNRMFHAFQMYVSCVSSGCCKRI